MADTLSIVQKFFPNVKYVKDAKSGTSIEVTKRDESVSTRRSHKTCALAVACKRKFRLDGVVISIQTAYLVKGEHATRYKLPESVSREVVSFDRHGIFEPGEYRLNKPNKGHVIGTKGGNKKSTGTGTKKGYYHLTGNIRTALGSKELAE